MKLNKSFFINLVSGLTVGLLVGGIVLAFNNPTGNPTTGGGIIGAASGAPASSLYIDSAGEIGIGTAGPGAKLEISGGQVVSQGASPTAAQLRITGTGVAGTGNDAIIRFGTASNGRIIYLDESDSNKLKITGGGMTDQVIINNDGNVGIGTTDPGTKLEVVGDTKSSRFYSFTASVTAPSGIATTIYTIPAGVGGIWLIAVDNFGDAAHYGAFAIVNASGAVETAAVLYNVGSGLMPGITVSGKNVQIRQNSGSSLGVTATFTKIY
ncbi:MAG: hypothetical protein WC475_00345 [Candidatus Paceibacterota bacterium]